LRQPRRADIRGVFPAAAGGLIPASPGLVLAQDDTTKDVTLMNLGIL